MLPPENARPETQLLHAGYDKSETRACAVPIYQTTSYLFDSTEHAAELFGLKKFGNIYTRLMNPTTDVFEKRVAALEGGAGALAVASGQSAITLALLNLTRAGDEIVSLDNLYGGTYNLLHYTFARLGITVRFAPSKDLGAVEAAITPKTRALYAESLGNPKLDVADIAALSAIAKRHGLPLVIDNTLTPYLLQPIAHGADIVVYSATKYLGGHGTSLGGVIVDAGRFNWESGKFPTIAGPDPSYHGVDFVEALRPLGNIAYIIKARTVLLRDLGPALAPMNAWLLLQGLETLHLRMQRHSENALQVAQHLENHPKVAWVNYPGLENSPEHERAGRYLPKGASGILGFGIVGGTEAGRRFIDGLKLLSHLANVGDAKSLAIHPASTTHSQLTREERLAGGIEDGLIRLSVGLEDPRDLVEDLDRAFSAAR